MCGVEDEEFNKCDVISEYMIERDVRFLHVINYLHASIIGSFSQGVAYFISIFTIFITLSVWV